MGVPDDVDVVARHQEYSRIVLLQLEKLAVSLDGRAEEDLVSVVRQRNLNKVNLADNWIIGTL